MPAGGRSKRKMTIAHVGDAAVAASPKSLSLTQLNQNGIVPIQEEELNNHRVIRAGIQAAEEIELLSHPVVGDLVAENPKIEMKWKTRKLCRKSLPMMTSKKLRLSKTTDTYLMMKSIDYGLNICMTSCQRI